MYRAMIEDTVGVINEAHMLLETYQGRQIKAVLKI
jgi:hypothetical protein